MPLFRKFFEGPKVMRSLDHRLIEKGDLDLATYIGPKDQDEKYDSDLVFATKNFRKLNQRTPDNLFKLNFWYIQDP